MPRQRRSPAPVGDHEIKVEVSEEESEQALVGSPKAFTLEGERHVVAETVSTWRDESFSGGYRRNAWLGHERVFFRVRTEAGELFDIYFDQGERRRRGKGRWVMHRRLAAGAATPEAAPSEPQSAPAEEQPSSEAEP